MTSPPLTMLVASVTQAVRPSQELPSRLAHAVLFAIPIFLLVWHVTWREHGPRPALAALLVLLASPLVLYYGACVRPDSPLVLFSLLSLWCFYRAIQSGGRADLWSLAAAVSLFVAVWAKFQSVCVPAAILAYLGYLLARRDRAALRRAVRPLAAMGVAGAGALAALYVYLYVVPGPVDDYSFGGIWGSYQALTAQSQTWSQALRSYAWVITLGVVHVGWPLVPASIGALPRREASKLTPLLVCFCLATILFNLWVHTSPGAGAWYLAPLVPAVAILVGACLARALAETRPARAALLLVVVGAAIVLQWRDRSPWEIPLPGAYANPPREIGRYIHDHSPAGSGVLADTSAIEFYADRPTSRIQFVPPEVVLRYLGGTGPCVVTHVVLRRYSTQKPPPNLAGAWQQCRRLLAEHFRPVAVGPEGIQVFERNGVRDPSKGDQADRPAGAASGRTAAGNDAG